MIEVPLKNSDLTTLIDEEDVDLVKKGVRITDSGYVSIAGAGMNLIHVRILKRILGCELPEKTETDHINRNPLDNTRKNLRLVTRKQNVQNTGPNKGKKYKGVSKSGRGWRADIFPNNNKISIGTFLSEKMAALAYDHVARKLYGEFCYLNFPNETISDDELDKARSAVKGFIPASGEKGISFDEKFNTYRVRAWVNGKCKYVGTAKDLINAVQMRNEAIVKITEMQNEI